MVYKLKNWYICNDPKIDAYKAPELCRGKLCGNVYGHPYHEDGKRIRTSRIAVIDKKNRTITTYSGSVYELLQEDVDKKYQEITKEKDPFPRWVN